MTNRDEKARSGKYHHRRKNGSYSSQSPQRPEEDLSHLDEPLVTSRYIVFDIETTGGNPGKNGITEICALKFQQGNIIDTFYSLVNPKISVPPIVRRMTGITNELLKNAPMIEDVMPSFVEFIGRDPLVSHNTSGDMKFLAHFSAQTTGTAISNFFLCTHLLVELLFPETPHKSLKGLVTFFKLPQAKAHRAEADAYATLELFKILLAKLQTMPIRTIADAIRFQGDYDSGIRLGWAVKPDILACVPRGPGMLYLFDHQR